MNFREQILRAVKDNLPEPVALPNLENFGIQYSDKVQAFKESLAAAGGQLEIVESEEELKAKLDEFIKEYPQRYSQIEGYHNFQLTVERPHDYEPLDLAIMQGSIAVAENAAIYLSYGQDTQRSPAYIAQHLCMVFKESDLVDNMHQAYAKISQDKAPNCSVFISGPSKTADIEQCLVKGAHGAKSLTVYMKKGE